MFLSFSIFVYPQVPGATLGLRPLKDCKVPAVCNYSARKFAPGAPLGPSPLEDSEVLVSRSRMARLSVPGAPLGPRPLQDREVPVLRSVFARPMGAPGPAPISALTDTRPQQRI